MTLRGRGDWGSPLTGRAGTEPAEPTVELTKTDVIRLITPSGIFWNGCRCESCRALRVKLVARFPGFARQIGATASTPIDSTDSPVDTGGSPATVSQTTHGPKGKKLTSEDEGC